MNTGPEKLKVKIYILLLKAIFKINILKKLKQIQNKKLRNFFTNFG